MNSEVRRARCLRRKRNLYPSRPDGLSSLNPPQPSSTFPFPFRSPSPSPSHLIPPLPFPRRHPQLPLILQLLVPYSPLRTLSPPHSLTLPLPPPQQHTYTPPHQPTPHAPSPPAHRSALLSPKSLSLRSPRPSHPPYQRDKRL